MHHGAVPPAGIGLLAGLLSAGGARAGCGSGLLSAGGARAGCGSGLLSGVFGLGAITAYFIWKASAATGFVAGLWPIAIAIMAFAVLPAIVVGGVLGGSARRPPERASAPPDPDRGDEGRLESGSH